MGYCWLGELARAIGLGHRGYTRIWGNTDGITFAKKDMEDAEKGLADRDESEEKAAGEKYHLKTEKGLKGVKLGLKSCEVNEQV